jgi:hypothetical protein
MGMASTRLFISPEMRNSATENSLWHLSVAAHWGKVFYGGSPVPTITAVGSDLQLASLKDGVVRSRDIRYIGA